MAKMRNVKGLQALDKYKDFDWEEYGSEEPEDDDDLVAIYGSSDGDDVFLLPKDLKELYDTKNTDAMLKLAKMANLPKDARIGPWGYMNDEADYFDSFDYNDLNDASLKELGNIRSRILDKYKGGAYNLGSNSWEEPFDISAMSPTNVAKYLRINYPGVREWDNDALGDEIQLYRSLYDRVPENFQDYSGEGGLENIYEPIINGISNDDFLKPMLPWLYDASTSKLEDIPPEAIADLKRAIHSDKGLPEPDFFETYLKSYYNNGDDDWEKRYNDDASVKAINEYKRKKSDSQKESEPKEEKSDKDTVSDMTQKNIIAGLKSFNI